MLSYIVSTAKGDRGRLYDANGQEIVGAVAADLVSGTCVYEDWLEDQVVTKVMDFPAPLKFIRPRKRLIRARQNT